MTDNIENHIDSTEEKKKQKKSKDAEFVNVTIVEQPNASLPNLIKELLDKNFTLSLSKTGYYLHGFYGMNKSAENQSGSIFFQETSDPTLLAFYDHKGNKHPVRSFEDIVSLNATIWGVYYKLSPDYKKPDTMWFPYMIEYGVLNIAPPAR